MIGGSLLFSGIPPGRAGSSNKIQTNFQTERKTMNIPKKVKIGGKVYKVEITKNLDLGNSNCSAEIDYLNLVIRVTPQAKQKMECDFIHELIHAILSHLGYSEQDEKKVDELASALYMVIQDNKKMFLPQ